LRMPSALKIEATAAAVASIFSALGMRNHLAVKVRYRLGSRNC
jgi:hypothetical protein